MAGLLDMNSNLGAEMDARIVEIANRLRDKSSLPLGGKSARMGVNYPSSVGSEGAAGNKAYDAVMNNLESELQDLLVRRHGPEKGSLIFQKILPLSGVWSGIENRKIPNYRPGSN